MIVREVRVDYLPYGDDRMRKRSALIFYKRIIVWRERIRPYDSLIGVGPRCGVPGGSTRRNSFSLARRERRRALRPDRKSIPSRLRNFARRYTTARSEERAVYFAAFRTTVDS